MKAVRPTIEVAGKPVTFVQQFGRAKRRGLDNEIQQAIVEIETAGGVEALEPYEFDCDSVCYANYRN